jgi:hypothetical protein
MISNGNRETPKEKEKGKKVIGKEKGKSDERTSHKETDKQSYAIFPFCVVD